MFWPLVSSFRFLRTFIAIFCFSSLSAWAESPENVGFYYGDEAPISTLYGYDWLVLQPDMVAEARIDLLGRGGTKPLAYVAIDEIARSHQLYLNIREDWVLGENPAWDSVILDITNQDVQEFILDELIFAAVSRGFQGVFLDTLDSHRLTERGRSRTAEFAKAQASVISALKARHPDAIVIANRGFHLPASTKQLVDALAFESYFAGYDANTDRYRPVAAKDRAWLDVQIDEWLEASPDTAIIAIDYTETESEAVEISRELRKLGMLPVVTDHSVTRLPPTAPSRVINQILVLHDLPSSQTDQSHAHARLGVILEQLGFVPKYLSAHNPLPDESISDKYAGIAVWWQAGQQGSSLCRWLEEKIDGKVPVVLLGAVPNSSSCRRVVGADNFRLPRGSLRIQLQQRSVGRFEGTRFPKQVNVALPIANAVDAWVTVTDTQGMEYAPIYTSDAGGVAITPFLFEPGPDNTALWLFDPVAFMREALQPKFPVAIDTTTESGRRMLTSHIDGDGFVSRAEQAPAKIAGQVILEDILQEYYIPHTVSVIEAEVSSEGIFPEHSKTALDVAQQIFSEPNIEVASHTFSHPYFWPVIEGGPAPPPEDTLYGYSLPVEGYEIDLKREIPDSVQFVNRLAPVTKPTRVFLWSGDARPGPQALSMVRKLGLVNVNGGNTRPLPYHSRLADVWPDGRPVGDELQIYAPVMNENVYTNLWTGPFYGYRHAKESFALLEEPYRLKPAGIYYHFYSGTKLEALKALKEVYDAALAKPNTPVPLSTYAERVQSRYYSTLTVNEDGAYRWKGYQHPRSVLISPELYPDLNRSIGVSGYTDHGRQRFVHLVGADHLLFLSAEAVDGPFLKSANSSITDWERTETGDGKWKVRMSISGHVAPELEVGGVKRCAVISNHKVEVVGENKFRLSAQRLEGLELVCR